MNDYTLGLTKDSYDLSHRDHERYEAERELSDSDWEQEREAKILARAEEMFGSGEYLREALCSDEIVAVVRGAYESDFTERFTTVMSELLWKMAIEEVDKEYS